MLVRIPWSDVQVQELLEDARTKKISLGQLKERLEAQYPGVSVAKSTLSYRVRGMTNCNHNKPSPHSTVPSPSTAQQRSRSAAPHSDGGERYVSTILSLHICVYACTYNRNLVSMVYKSGNVARNSNNPVPVEHRKEYLFMVMRKICYKHCL